MSTPVEAAAPAATSFPVGELFEFVAALRVDYAFGIDEFRAVQSLLIELARRDALPDDPRALQSALSPILCSNAQEQRDFPKRYQRWLDDLASGRGTVPSRPPRRSGAPASGEFERVLSRGRRVRLLTAFIVSLVIASASCFLIRDRLWPAAPIEPPDAQTGAVILPPLVIDPHDDSWGLMHWSMLAAGSSAALLLMWFGFWAWQGRRFLRRGGSAPGGALGGVISLEAIPLPPLAGHTSPSQAARHLRQREQAATRYLDLSRTVMASVCMGGEPREVYRYHTRVPEYLCLIDRRCAEDLAAATSDHLLRLLRAQGVFVRCYHFDADARLLFPMDPGAGSRTLDALSTDYASHRLLILGDGAGFVDPITGRAARWLEMLRRFRDVALLTPEARGAWGPREGQLQQAGLRILPLTLDGIAAYRSASVERALRAHAPRLLPLYPLVLELDERRWLHADPPSDAEIEEGLEEVRRYLGGAGVLWLTACCVYPRIHWQLTLALGKQLRFEGAPIFEAELAARLSRMPWIREAYAPDWLRRRLLAQLPRGIVDELRAIVQRLMLSAADPGVVKRLDLEIEQAERLTLRSLWRRVSKQRRQSADADPAFRDRVFMDWTNDALSLRLPAIIARRMVRTSNGVRTLKPPSTTAVIGSGWLLGIAFVLLGEAGIGGGTAASVAVLTMTLPILRHYGSLADRFSRRHVWLGVLVPLLAVTWRILIADTIEPNQLAGVGLVLVIISLLLCTLLVGGGWFVQTIKQRWSIGKRLAAAGYAVAFLLCGTWLLYPIEHGVRRLARMRLWPHCLLILDGFMPDRWLFGTSRPYVEDRAPLRQTAPSAFLLGLLSMGLGTIAIAALPHRYVHRGAWPAAIRTLFEGTLIFLGAALGAGIASASSGGMSSENAGSIASFLLIPAGLLAFLSARRAAKSTAAGASWRALSDGINPDRIWCVGPRGMLFVIASPLLAVCLTKPATYFKDWRVAAAAHEQSVAEPPAIPMAAQPLDAELADVPQPSVLAQDALSAGAEATKHAAPILSSKLNALEQKLAEVPNKPSPGDFKPLNADQLSRVVLAHRSSLERCLQSEDGGQAVRRVTAELTIAPSGSVMHVTMTGVAASALSGCLEAVLRTWRFPRSSGPTTARLPIVFAANPSGLAPVER